uniref:Transcriptional regulator n=1 Tax=Ascaris lumbricoides TaxID=6252 RepID=A0A0M3IMP7_ASCLU
MDEEERSPEEQRALLESRIAEARSIADTVDREFASVDGASKFKNRIKAELRFLIDVS